MHVCVRLNTKTCCVGYFITAVKVFGGNFNYNLAVDGPWKQFQDRDVENVNESARLVYDTDAQVVTKESAFIVFHYQLRKLSEMPATWKNAQD